MPVIIEVMAGGMRSRMGQQERLAAMLAQAGALAGGSRATEAAGAARHCWVVDPDGWPGTWPGLLHSWQRGPAGWTGLVTFAAIHHEQQVIVQTDLPADRLRPL